MIEVPAGTAFTEPDENAIDQLAAEGERSSTSVPAPTAELTPWIDPLTEIDDRCRTAVRVQDRSATAVFMLDDPGSESIAATDDAAPGFAEEIRAELRREDEGEGHVVERALGIELLPDPDLHLVVRQL